MELACMVKESCILKFGEGFVRHYFSQTMRKPKNDKRTQKPILVKGETLKEPSVTHLKTIESKRITFSTISEQEQDNYLYWLALAPEQRIANVTELIRKIYSDQLNLPPENTRIVFDLDSQ